MPWWGIMLFIISGLVTELITTFLFNFKIIFTKHENFLLASLFGAGSTMIYLTFSSLSIYYGLSFDQIWITILSFSMLALGSFLATIVFNELNKRGIIKNMVAKKKLFNRTKKTECETDTKVIEEKAPSNPEELIK
ncbi:MAG: hypothetical protein HRS57_00335 [Mycoplasmataceae bacterium]|nr:hypothetical protein [Mycoplasmataceae bacterium]